ncbi:hypothetical protein JXB12_03830 [candidate division KSB1 bacterium]|nr:hypothetical protein [candidate division KSB1 bacterium]
MFTNLHAWNFIVLYLTLSLIPAPVQATDHQTYDQNLTVFKTMVEGTVDQFVQEANLSKENKLIIDSQGNNDRRAMFIDVWMTGRLRDSGFDSIYVRSDYATVVTTDSTKTTDFVVIKYNVVEFFVTYNGTRSFWREKPVTRSFISNLMFHISDEHGYAKWSGTIKKDQTDIVPYSQLSKLETESIDFTRSTLPSKSIFSSYVEPLFVIGVTGTVIYLFYALRSK